MSSKIAIFALMLAGLVSTGCSTANTGANMSDYESMRQEAWGAYNSCLDALAPYGRQSECDNVGYGSGNQATYNTYNYGYAQQGTPAASYYQPTQVQTPQEYYGYSTPPPYYMYSATPDEVNEMTGKWLALAQDPSTDL